MPSRFNFCCTISLPRQVCPLLGLRHRCRKRLLLKPTRELRVSQEKLTMLDRHSNARNPTTTYSPEDCSKIGRYAAEHGLTKASRHFMVPESTARLFEEAVFSGAQPRAQEWRRDSRGCRLHVQFFCYSHLI